MSERISREKYLEALQNKTFIRFVEPPELDETVDEFDSMNQSSSFWDDEPVRDCDDRE